jgi:hypothetical protein
MVQDRQRDFEPTNTESAMKAHRPDRHDAGMKLYAATVATRQNDTISMCPKYPYE